MYEEDELAEKTDKYGYLNNFILAFLDKYKLQKGLGKNNMNKEVNRLKKYLPIIFNTFTKRINYKYNSLKSSEIKFIDKSFPSYSTEIYDNLLKHTLDIKERLSGKFSNKMINPKDMDKIYSTPITEAEFTVDQYSFIDLIKRAGSFVLNLFFKDEESKNRDLDESDKSEFQQLYDKYSKLNESDRKKEFDNFKKELKALILRMLEKLKNKHLVALEKTKASFTDENIKKYLVHKLYGLEKKTA